MMLKRKGTVIEHRVYSKFLQEEVGLMIYLPEHYSPLFSYPTLYVQDAEDYFTLGKLVTQLDTLIEQGAIPRCIAVGITVPKEERRKRYSRNGSKHVTYSRFVAEELVPYIDEKFATFPISGARTIMGESLGGTISLSIALAYPQTFHYVILQSGAFYEAGNLEAIADYSHSPALLSIYQSVGTEEKQVATGVGEIDLLENNRQINKQLTEKGIPVHYHEFEGNHTWTYWQSDLAHALCQIWAD